MIVSCALREDRKAESMSERHRLLCCAVHLEYMNTAETVKQCREKLQCTKGAYLPELFGSGIDFCSFVLSFWVSLSSRSRMSTYCLYWFMSHGMPAEQSSSVFTPPHVECIQDSLLHVLGLCLSMSVLKQSYSQQDSPAEALDSIKGTCHCRHSCYHP